MFKYLFTATFEDGHQVKQDHDDRSINHVEGAEKNPSAFTDVLDYSKKSDVAVFSLESERGDIYAVSLKTGEFFVNGHTFMLDQPMEELTDRKLIYFRTRRLNMVSGDQYTHAYNFGYEGTTPAGKRLQKIITVR